MVISDAIDVIKHCVQLIKSYIQDRGRQYLTKNKVTVIYSYSPIVKVIRRYQWVVNELPSIRKIHTIRSCAAGGKRRFNLIKIYYNPREILKWK